MNRDRNEEDRILNPAGEPYAAQPEQETDIPAGGDYAQQDGDDVGGVLPEEVFEQPEQEARRPAQRAESREEPELFEVRPKAGGQPPKKKKSNARLIAIIVAAVVVIAAAVGVYAWWTSQQAARQDELLAQTTIYPGIRINGVDVGGLTREEAQAKVDQANTQTLADIAIKLNHDGQDIALDFTKAGLTFDTASALDEAVSLGKDGEREARLQKIEELAKGYDITVPMELSDEAQLDAMLDEALNGIGVAAQDAKVTAFHPDQEVKFEYQEGTPGKEPNREEIASQLKTMLSQEQKEGSIAVTLQDVQPAVTVAQLKEQTQLVSKYQTTTTSNSNRNTNIRLACDSFQGRVLQPGEEFSFNNSTGERSTAKGYKAAPAIKNGNQFVDEPGGGVCQVSSTLYNAVLMADLEVTERYHHSIKSTYVPAGLDATVNYGGADFKFKNNKDTPVYLAYSFANQQLTVYIYGAPLADGVTIKTVGEVVGSIDPPADKTTVDNSLKPGERVQVIQRRTGTIAKGYKVYYDKDGNKVDTVLLHTDRYPAVQGEYRVGPNAPAATPTPSQSAEPSPSTPAQPTPSADPEPETPTPEQPAEGEGQE